MDIHQIKEALNKIADHTKLDPNSSVLTKTEPNDIRITCTNNLGNEFDFRYSDGQLFLWTKNNETWLQY